MEIVKKAPGLAMRNKSKLLDKCACYYCYKFFNVSDIKEWTDENNTALCPFCNVDAVLPDDGLNKEILKKINDYWF